MLAETTRIVIEERHVWIIIAFIFMLGWR